MNSKHSNGKVLVTYFSAIGATARAVKKLVEVVDRDPYPTAPAQSYTSADLGWSDKQSRSSVGVNNPKMRPATKGRKESIGAYNVVLIGYPIWRDLTSRIIDTFIESHNLKDKAVVLFATSGGGSAGNSATVLKKTYSDLGWKEGRLPNRTDEKAIRAWFDVVAVK